MNARNPRQFRQNFLVNALEIPRAFRLAAQKIIRAARHQITFADFRISPHRVFETVEKILRLPIQRDLHDDRNHLAAGKTAGQCRVPANNPFPLENIDPAKAGGCRKSDLCGKLGITDAGIEPKQADDMAVGRIE
ncbi:hypothetical protein D3C87_1147930 [compost metagenome]